MGYVCPNLEIVTHGVGKEGHGVKQFNTIIHQDPIQLINELIVKK
jgi:hypothetical protein